MSLVRFVFDAEKDAWNIWDTCNSEESYGMNFKQRISKKLVLLCEGKKFEKVKDEILKVNEKLYASEVVKIQIKALQNSWNKIEDKFFKRLKKITGKKFEKKITCYITTISKCPYYKKENWFMVSLFSSILNSLSICGHEILHLHFHKYYFDGISKKIGKSKTHDLKESLTFLLNKEFKDLWFAQDFGYEKHKELRSFLEVEWDKNHDFESLLNKGVNFLEKR